MMLQSTVVIAGLKTWVTLVGGVTGVIGVAIALLQAMQ